MADTIRESIENAVKEEGISEETDEWGTLQQQSPEETSTEVVEEEETKEEETKEEVKEEDAEEPEEEEKADSKNEEFETNLDNTELKQAEELFLLLKGPNAIEAVKQMAERAGLLNQAPAKEEPKEENSEFKKFVSEALGGEFKFLNDRVTKAFIQYDKLAQKRAEDLREIETKSRADQVLEAELRSFGKEHDLSIDGSSSDPVSNKMAELAESFTFVGSDVNKFKTYLNRLHTMAVLESGGDTEKVARIKKINKNLRESEPGSVSGSERSVRKGPENVNPRMAVEAALRHISCEE